jgi:hypothetical protein
MQPMSSACPKVSRQTVVYCLALCHPVLYALVIEEQYDMTTFHIDHRHIQQPAFDRACKEMRKKVCIIHLTLLAAIAILGLLTH